MSRILSVSLAAAAAATVALSVETQSWLHSTEADFQKATLEKLSLGSTGRLRLAPVFEELHDASCAYLWAVAEDSKGNVYYGGGSPGDSNARLYRRDAAGSGRVLAEMPELAVQAIAIDKQDRVYAATSPDGKVYRVNAAGEAEVFYDPKAKYIWALAFDSQGSLFVATGGKGEIHRVAPAGAGSVFFETHETHARSLVVEANGNLLVGTEPGGLIIRVSQQGRGFVLYQAPKRETTALAVHSDGSIYAAVAGAKAPAVPFPKPIVPQPAPAAPGAASPAQPGGSAQAPPSSTVVGGPAAPGSLFGAPVSGGSEIYRIHPDGYARKVWEDSQDIVYSMAFDAGGRVVFGTGNRGHIYRLDSDLLYTRLLRAAPTQVTSLAAGRGNRIHAVTGNVGKLYRLGPELEPEGTLSSEVLDAGFFSAWGRLRYEGELQGGAVAMESRGGNLDQPEKNWSPWEAVAMQDGVGRIASPAARFLQYRLTLRASSGGLSPELNLVEAAYLPRNVRPRVELIEITPPNYRFPPQSLTLTPSQNLTLAPLGRTRRVAPAPISGDSSANTMQAARGWLGARWLARDDNDDPLRFRVDIRGVNEGEWKLLKDELKDRHISWDSAQFPDGVYVLRVQATDAPGNPPAQALQDELISDPFVVDNSPPAIEKLAASRQGSRVTVRWQASDSLNALGGAEYALNGGAWMVVEPTTRLTDSSRHAYVLDLDPAPPGEVVIAVRVRDAFDNQAVEKTVVR